MLAALEVFLHPGAHLLTDLAVKVFRDLAPDLFATDFHYHGLTCWYSARPVLQLPSIPGARASRICRRARKRRVFTALFLIPSNSAVSSILKCCTSLRTNTSLCLGVSEASARDSACRNSFFCTASEGISRQSAKSRGI